MIRYFRKKPILVPMIEWTGHNLDEIQEFTGSFSAQGEHASLDSWVDIPRFHVVGSDNMARVYNDQEEQWLNVPVGHHVVKGARSEFYPISPAVLEQTYDEVTDEVTC